MVDPVRETPASPQTKQSKHDAQNATDQEGEPGGGLIDVVMLMQQNHYSISITTSNSNMC